MNSYEKIKRDLKGRESKRLNGVATYAKELAGGAVGVQYHDTVVIKAWPDGSFKLDNGGYRTATTKERINRYLPDGCHLYQKDFEWIIDTPKGKVPFISTHLEEEKEDGEIPGQTSF